MMKGAVILSIAAFIIVSLSVFAGASIFLFSILKSQLFTETECNTLSFSRYLKKVG